MNIWYITFSSGDYFLQVYNVPMNIFMAYEKYIMTKLLSKSTMPSEHVNFFMLLPATNHTSTHKSIHRRLAYSSEEQETMHITQLLSHNC